MVAEKIGSELCFRKLCQMVNNASRSSTIQNLADKICCAIVVAVSVITFFVWAKFGPEGEALIYGFINARSQF
jgi:Cu2+-exporting ATPase